MSKYGKKILVSGCGFSWGAQVKKTWVNVLRLAGIDIVDVGGPAVSNQWIINRAVEFTINNSTDAMVIQLTGLGKLDVEVNTERQQELVNTDSLRNFTIGNVWPSSRSVEHVSKQLYERWLMSPGLETQDLFCKLAMLKTWCQARKIQLLVLQGYAIPWTGDQVKYLSQHVFEPGQPLYEDYRASKYFSYHDHTDQNTVPNLGYQSRLALDICKKVCPTAIEQVTKIQQQVDQKQFIS